MSTPPRSRNYRTFETPCESQPLLVFRQEVTNIWNFVLIILFLLLIIITMSFWFFKKTVLNNVFFLALPICWALYKWDLLYVFFRDLLLAFSIVSWNPPTRLCVAITLSFSLLNIFHCKNVPQRIYSSCIDGHLDCF